MPPQPIYAAYFAAQAAVGVAFWVALSTSDVVRSWIELMPGSHAVTDAFVVADAVAVAGSVAAARGLASGARWSVPVVAFTAGAMVYPTLYLVGWVAFTGVGAATLAIMVPPSTLTAWISYQTWRADRRSVRTSSR